MDLEKKNPYTTIFLTICLPRLTLRKLKSIPVNSKEAKLITSHPSSSYELVRDKDNKIASIDIKDPDQFWKISKYAVVEIK